MSESHLTPDDVVAFYGAGDEATRLTSGPGLLEFARSKEIIGAFLPPGSVVADIGGGAGSYAEWLADDGHRVELVDPVPRHVDLARRRAGHPPRFGVHAGDARTLSFADESFDAALLLGPFYHLGERRDRTQALSEAMRVCRVGGVIFVAAISRYAPLLDSLRSGAIRDEQTLRNVQVETLFGRRVSSERRKSSFPDAYFHLPGELEEEVAHAGLDVHAVCGVEGPGWLLNDLETRWKDGPARERILWAARTVETDPCLIAVSAHLLAVAFKPVPSS